MDCFIRITRIIFLISFFFFTKNLYAVKNLYTCDIEEGKPLTNAYGPWDYLNPEHQKKLPIVINAHFTSDVKNLIRGTTNVHPLGDIDYTLRAIPNYHPALYAISQLEKREKLKLLMTKPSVSLNYSAECYLKRAIYFQPSDHISRMLYAMYFQQNNKYKLAEKEYLNGLNIQPQDPELNYNIGLLYMKMDLVHKAEKHANIAYSYNYPLQGLKNKIDRAKNRKNK